VPWRLICLDSKTAVTTIHNILSSPGQDTVLHVPGRPRSGADYYNRHLFIRVLSHTLNQDGESVPNVLEQIARSSSPEPFDPVDEIEGLPKYSTEGSRTSGFMSKFKSPHKSATIEPGGYDVEDVNVSRPPQTNTYSSFCATHAQGQSTNKTVLKLMRELREGGREDINIKPVCIYLFKDGTVISIHPDSDLKFTEPIRRRLTQRDTGPRSTADASLLVHGLLDLVVDATLEIVDAYQRKIIE